MSAFTLGELARAVAGTLEGDPGLRVAGIASLETASEDEVSFVVATRHVGAATRSRAAALVVPRDLSVPGRPVIRVDQPYAALATLLRMFHPEAPSTPGVHPTAVVAPGVRVAAEATVGPFAVVGRESVIEAGAVLHALVFVGDRCRVGEGSVLHPHVVLREAVTLGRRVVLHPGVVLGGDGFGYVFTGGEHQKIPQVGRVVIEDDVEIGANTTIDRATLGETRIGRGTKIDNLVQIGHNVAIGGNTIIVGQVGIAGSSRIGSGVVLAGQVGVADHVTIGDGARVGSQAGVHASVPPGGEVLGSPAMEAPVTRRVFAALPRLPDLLRTVRRLERRVVELERRVAASGATGG